MLAFIETHVGKQFSEHAYGYADSDAVNTARAGGGSSLDYS